MSYSREKYQIEKYGKTKRTTQDKNEIIIKDGFAEIILYNKFSKEISRTIIDIKDIEKCRLHKWHLMKAQSDLKYVITDNNKKTLLLHRFILDYSGNLEIDHIDHNGLDNRRSNLRIVTHEENMNNKKQYKNSKEKYIWYEKSSKRFRVAKWINGKKVYFGSYKNIENAIQKRNKVFK